MKKVILDYDEVTGSLYDKNGVFIASYIGLPGDEIIKLKEKNLI